VLIDDMVDTAGTLCQAAGAEGARRPQGRRLHHAPGAVRSGRRADRKSELDELVVTDTIPLNEEAEGCPKIRQLSTAELLAETMRRISDEESVSSLYVD
jgi:ribose-phosphate pyrophosphokinase